MSELDRNTMTDTDAVVDAQAAESAFPMTITLSDGDRTFSSNQLRSIEDIENLEREGWSALRFGADALALVNEARIELALANKARVRLTIDN